MPLEEYNPSDPNALAALVEADQQKREARAAAIQAREQEIEDARASSAGVLDGQLADVVLTLTRIEDKLADLTVLITEIHGQIHG